MCVTVKAYSYTQTQTQTQHIEKVIFFLLAPLLLPPLSSHPSTSSTTSASTVAHVIFEDHVITHACTYPHNHTYMAYTQTRQVYTNIQLYAVIIYACIKPVLWRSRPAARVCVLRHTNKNSPALSYYGR